MTATKYNKFQAKLLKTTFLLLQTSTATSFVQLMSYLSNLNLYLNDAMQFKSLVSVLDSCTVKKPNT
jgi:hypothetical protein